MKHKHMFSLLDQSFTTVHVTFDPVALEPGRYDVVMDDAWLEDGPRQDRDRASDRAKKTLRMQFAGQAIDANTYIYKVPKDWFLVKGDQVLVDTPRGGLKVATVVKVDPTPDIDLDADFDYKWVVQKVDVAPYEALVDKEKRFNEMMQDVERIKQREELVNSFRNSLPEGSEALRLFEQTTQSIAAPIPSPPPAAAPAWAPPPPPSVPSDEG